MGETAKKTAFDPDNVIGKLTDEILVPNQDILSGQTRVRDTTGEFRDERQLVSEKCMRLCNHEIWV